MAWPVTVRPEVGNHFTRGEPQILDLGRDIDVVMDAAGSAVRFELHHRDTSARAHSRRNARRKRSRFSVRNAPEKLFVLDYARFMPPTMITRSLGATRHFLEEHGEIVIKPLHGNGGKAIFKVGRDGANLSALVEVFNAAYVEPHMVQAFVPAVAQGDKRIVLVDGKVAGAVNRIPGEGEIRSNLAVGGTAAKTELTAREQEICAALGPELKRRGLIFVGIDVIGGEWLTEINVTSPTGIVAVDRFDGTDTAGAIWDAIGARLHA